MRLLFVSLSMCTQKSSFTVFGDPQKSSVGNGHVSHSGDFVMRASPKLVSWNTPVHPPPNNKTASLNIFAQEMKKVISSFIFMAHSHVCMSLYECYVYACMRHLH